MPELDPVLRAVRDQITAEGLTLKAAADQMGVTLATLQRHLDGAYVRSDSMAKYRSWLSGQSPSTTVPARETVPEVTTPTIAFSAPAIDHEPYTVVDLFSGCGGMSLGFDHFEYESRSVFETVLAIDSQEKVVRLHNDNSESKTSRWLDLSDFVNEAEILAFYLEHLARVRSDLTLKQELSELRPFSLEQFQQLISGLDADCFTELQSIRESDGFALEYGSVDSTVFGQTSVIGFHEALSLPMTSRADPRHGPMIWAGCEQKSRQLDSVELVGFAEEKELRSRRLEELWNQEVRKLQDRTQGDGKGQLASASQRIDRFLTFLDTPVMHKVKDTWLDWRANRDALRACYFDSEEILEQLKSLYVGRRRVDVLLGGPPCQGFSRIGRGKLRSLRENKVHVESDPEAGDQRNRLLHQYVLFISALEPRIFLFENVRHFQTTVKTPQGSFTATEILREAIQDLSQRRLEYEVGHQILDCSKHLIPQTRERFFLVGIHSGMQTGHPLSEMTRWCLTLPTHEPVPLRTALEGLPTPHEAKGARSKGESGIAQTVRVASAGESHPYLRWVRQRSPSEIDAHYIRVPRVDDAALFELFGPGKRWMDYRCDRSSTLQLLRQILESIQSAKNAVRDSSSNQTHPAVKILSEIDSDELNQLLESIDGSLSIRLLLESIEPGPGELQHHLLTPGYLGKREGNNGDWTARLHPDRPSKTIVSHMAKDTYAYIHPWESRTLSVREAARIQSFPDWFRFGSVGLVDAFRAIGNAVPPLLSHQLSSNVAQILWANDASPKNNE